MLENNDDFFTKAYEEIANEYVVIGLGSNNPDTRIERRA